MTLARRQFALALLLIIVLIILIGCTRTARLKVTTSPASSSGLPPNTPPSSAASTNTSLPCPVTMPNGSTPPGEYPRRSHHGNGALWTALWPDGRVVFTPDGPGRVLPDGSLAMKWPWWRGVRGKLTIEGNRLDGSATRLRARIPGGYGDIGFQATELIFPTKGCWEVTGKVSETSLTFVTLVTGVEKHN